MCHELDLLSYFLFYFEGCFTLPVALLPLFFIHVFHLCAVLLLFLLYLYPCAPLFVCQVVMLA